MNLLLEENREWLPANYPGIEFSWLWKNAEKGGTALLKLVTGACLPTHKHPGWEQIFILKGKVKFCNQVLSAGDFVSTTAGDVHGLVALEPSLFIVMSEKEGVELQ